MEPKSKCSKQKNNLKKHFFSHDGKVVVFPQVHIENSWAKVGKSRMVKFAIRSIFN